MVDSHYVSEASKKRGDPATPKAECILSTAPGMTKGLQATHGPEENTSESASLRPGQPASNRAEFFSLSSHKKNIFSWYAGIFSDTSTGDTLENSETNKQDFKSDVPNDDKLDESLIIDEKQISDTLTTMHLSLSSSRFKKYREYRKCPIGTVQEVNARLAALMKKDEQARRKPGKGVSPRRRNGNHDNEQDSPEADHVQYLSASTSDSEEISTGGRNRDRLLKEKKAFVHTLKKLHQLFLPLKYTSEMTEKYWGAVNLLLQVWVCDW